MFIIDDRYKNYGLEYTMSYTLTQYQTTPGISRDYVSTFELGSFSANNISVITRKSVIFKKSKIDFKSTGSVMVSFRTSGLISPAYFLFYMLSKLP